MVSGKPTTLSGYGISDGVSTKAGGMQTLQSSLTLAGLIRVFDAFTCSSPIGYVRYNDSTDALRFDSSGVSFSVAPKPLNAGGVSCGTSGRPFSEVWANDTSINTSDARLKTDVRPISDVEKAVALEIKQSIGFFQWLKVVREKGEDKARLHCGTTVQKVIEVFQRHGLDPYKYGVVCYDETDTIINERGEPEIVFIDRYSLRPTELCLFILGSM